MKIIKSTPFFVIFSVLLMILLVSFSGCTDKDNIDEQNFTILSENTCWSPIMSSIVGIDMTPVHKGNGEFLYHWTAEGDASCDVEFVSWGENTEFKVLEKGNDTLTEEGETIWWSYRGLEIESMPEKFTVRVLAVDEDTNETFFEKEISIKRKVMMFCIE